ncbi:hypothetical protein TanjilG_13500 [Lupinus angustifolius]|uniref:Myb-related protein 123 n=1 Tax=Lupinus angustifolius TaxID=3871 RepID=A0A4P1RVE1_LUPAN|nr:PREDICTED: myb-related protein 308-like [Lupinus angustifolius]OIW18748.1 hypothetical protein TanjilG_13500 [Lupinus angustifolius]
MERSPCCSKDGLNKGAWTPNEDKILIEFIKVHGEGRWRSMPKRAGLKRCGKSCRLRWLNYLRPDIKRGNISLDEEDLIIRLHSLLGNRWSLIAGRLPGRTDNEIKNYWNNHLGKKVKDGHQITTNSKSIENPKSKPSPKVKVKVTASPSHLKLDTHVVLKKTNKCSSMLIKNPLPQPSMQLHNMSKTEDAISNNDSRSDQIEPNDKSGFLSFINEEEKELSTDLLKDFMVRGDICSSDILNSDFSNMCDFSYSDNSNENILSSLSDEILMDWTQSSLAHETNVSNRE